MMAAETATKRRRARRNPFSPQLSFVCARPRLSSPADRRAANAKDCEKASSLAAVGSPFSSFLLFSALFFNFDDGGGGCSAGAAGNKTLLLPLLPQMRAATISL